MLIFWKGVDMVVCEMKYVNLQNDIIKIFQTHCSYSFLQVDRPMKIAGPFFFLSPTLENPKSGSPFLLQK